MTPHTYLKKAITAALRGNQIPLPHQAQRRAKIRHQLLTPVTRVGEMLRPEYSSAVGQLSFAGCATGDLGGSAEYDESP